MMGNSHTRVNIFTLRGVDHIQLFLGLIPYTVLKDHYW